MEDGEGLLEVDVEVFAFSVADAGFEASSELVNVVAELGLLLEGNVVPEGGALFPVVMEQ